MSKNIVKSLKFKKVDGFDYGEFSKLIDDAYNARRRGKKNTQKKTFSPSTVGYGHGNCPRYWFIAFNGRSSMRSLMQLPLLTCLMVHMLMNDYKKL
jgi:hypothetical protein